MSRPFFHQRPLFLLLLLRCPSAWGVALVEPALEDASLQETASRLRAELTADGVPVRGFSARPLTSLQEPLVEFRGEEIVVTLPSAQPGEPASVVHLSVPEVEASKKPAVLALRASELLVAWQHHRDEPAQPTTLPQVPPTPELTNTNPVPPVETTRAVGKQAAVFAQLGMGLSVSWGAVPAAGVTAALGVRIAPRFTVSLVGWGDATGTRFSPGGASAKMHLHMLLLEPRFLVPLAATWEVRVGPSLGGALLFGRGDAPSPKDEFNEVRAAWALGLGTGVYYRAEPYAVGLDARGFIALPTPVLLIEEERYPVATPQLQLGAVFEANL